MTMAKWQRPFDLARCKAKYQKQHARYVKALQAGQDRKARDLRHWLLDAPSARMLALKVAAMKKEQDLSWAKFEMAADLLSCWEDGYPPVRVHQEEKPNGGYRLALDYGLFRAAQQYLVRPVLQPCLRLHPGQYGVPGRGREHAVEKIKRIIRDGRHWVVRADIKDCFTSMDGEKVVADLPLPETVKRVVIMAPPEGYITYPMEVALWVDEVRRGLPPGSAVSSLVAAAVLAPVLDGLPDGAVAVLYVDDFAIFVSSKAEGEAVRDALQNGLMASPAGNLKLKFSSLQHVAEGFGFLGYHIFLNATGGVTAVPREAAFEKLYDRLEAIDAGASPGADKMATVVSWRCAYAAWEGGDHGDDVLYVILSNHFSVDLEELLQRLHLRAQKTRMKLAPT